MVAAHVRQALAQGRPVVALESTIITHGMPWPANLDTARQAEAEVRAGGAVPATIAVLEGIPCVGLDAGQLEQLARGAGSARKCSVRDLPLAMARGESGGTTVAATLHLASAAGIRVFATGGIGGVHRGAAQTFDISADLPALARYPLAVVCAGPKAILDLGLTLEVLETLGVPVLGFGTDELPAFWSRTSGHPVDARVDHARQVAELLEAQSKLGLDGGVLVCQPVPEAHALAPEVLATALAGALAAAEAEAVSGKALTPFLLQHVVQATGGESLAANQGLMAANARLAAAIAVALALAPLPGQAC
ncbi:MAG: pseudouridine-5'-phosphate glycosidase [Pseudomonadota bacterium]